MSNHYSVHRSTVSMSRHHLPGYEVVTVIGEDLDNCQVSVRQMSVDHDGYRTWMAPNWALDPGGTFIRSTGTWLYILHRIRRRATLSKIVLIAKLELPEKCLRYDN
jgi:hypothetical protein